MESRTTEAHMKRLEELLSAIGGAHAMRAVEEILVELLRAQQKHPLWPLDAVHASAVLQEEAGELTQAALDFHFGKEPEENRKCMGAECIQTGAMAVRFLLFLPQYTPKSKDQ